MAKSLQVEGKKCMDCQKFWKPNGTVQLICKKHFICDSCWHSREICPEFERKHLECQTCHPEVFRSMSPKKWIYVDDSNLWIEGKKAYAKAQKLDTAEDPRARFDIGQLAKVVAGESEVGARTLYGSEPPSVDTVWAKMKELGWKVEIKQRSYHTGKEKQVDSQLITDVVSVVYRKMSGTVIIVAGDVDYKPPIEEALARGWKVEVWSWEKALADPIKGLAKTSKGLDIKYLNDYIHEIMFVNRDFDPAEFTEKGLLSRLEWSILLTVDEHNLQQDGKSWKDTLESITKWPILYYEATKKVKGGYVQVLAIFLYEKSKKPDIATCIQQIVKAKKQLRLSTNPMRFCDLDRDKCVWLKPLLSQCKQLNEECRDNASDTHSVHSSRSWRLSKYKTELCRNHEHGCPKRDQCTFAHGYEDPEATCLQCKKKGHVQECCSEQVARAKR